MQRMTRAIPIRLLRGRVQVRRGIINRTSTREESEAANENEIESEEKASFGYLHAN